MRKNTTSKALSFAIVIASIAALPASVQAAFNLVNDFNTTTGTWETSSSSSSGVTRPASTVTFGSGSNYANLNDSSSGGFGYESGLASLGTSGSLAFEWFAPNQDWVISIGESAFSSSRAFTWGTTELFTTMGLSTGTSYQLNLLYNISGGSLTYDDPTIVGTADGTLTNNSAVMFAQPTSGGAFVKSTNQTRNGSVALQGLWFTRVENTGNSSTQLDTLQQSALLETVAAVPEPSAFALLAGILGISLALARRRNSSV